jgi:hypothetical protein
MHVVSYRNRIGAHTAVRFALATEGLSAWPIPRLDEPRRVGAIAQYRAKS